jgi:hypothetical protein
VPQPVPVPTIFSANRNALSEPRYLNWSVGVEKKFPAAVFLKAEFVEKRGVHGFAYNTLNGAVDGNFILGNTREDRYDAFSLTLRHNFREHYAIFGAYTRSRVHTNQAFDFSLDIPLLSPQGPGPYPWDVPNRFVGWGVLPFFKCEECTRSTSFTRSRLATVCPSTSGMTSSRSFPPLPPEPSVCRRTFP